MLPVALRDDLDAVAFTTMDGAPMTWEASLAANYTDGIVVLHNGTIVYERYFGALEPHIPHLAMSVTKSFVGLLAAMQLDAGTLDAAAPVTAYVPELAGSAYGDATVRHVLDMTIGVRYSETYTDPKAEIWAYTAATGISPRRPGYAGPDTIFEFLCALQKEGEHGAAFAYKTCNTEVLAWIVQRVSGVPLATMLSEAIWQKLGMDEDAYLLVDRVGTAMAGGGLNLTLRDLARFAEMMRGDAVSAAIASCRRRWSPTLPAAPIAAISPKQAMSRCPLELPQPMVGRARQSGGVFGARHPRPGGVDPRRTRAW